jgi:hypothetical protein
MSTAVTLPGGALINGQLVRTATFRPLTGRMEQRLAALAELPSIPHRVSGTLAVVLEPLGDEVVTPAVAAGLSVSDRQFLMLALALETGEDQQWRHLTCTACNAHFDIGFRLSEVPLTLSGEGYPWVETEIAGRHMRLRVPTGEDEAVVAELPAEEALQCVARRCVVSIDGVAPTPTVLADLDDAAIEAIDAALDAMAPQLGTLLSTACNECGAPHAFDIDPYRAMDISASALYHEVHELAMRYHWSEAQCLRLPRSRRRMYIDLIEQSLSASH